MALNSVRHSEICGLKNNDQYSCWERVLKPNSLFRVSYLFAPQEFAEEIGSIARPCTFAVDGSFAITAAWPVAKKKTVISWH